VTFLFVPQISREPLNGYAPNSQGRRVWSLAWTSLNVKIKAAIEWNTLAGNNVTQQQMGPFRCFGWGAKGGKGVILAVCVWFMFGKTSLGLVILLNFWHNITKNV